MLHIARIPSTACKRYCVITPSFSLVALKRTRILITKRSSLPRRAKFTTCTKTCVVVEGVTSHDCTFVLHWRCPFLFAPSFHRHNCNDTIALAVLSKINIKQIQAVTFFNTEGTLSPGAKLGRTLVKSFTMRFLLLLFFSILALMWPTGACWSNFQMFHFFHR